MKSVFSQTYPQLEYLIIDGGSDDGTVEIVHQFRDGVDYFIREPDNGIYDAMNKGIKIATGEILFFLNSDDYFADPKVVEDVAKVYRENPKVDVVFGNQIFDKGDRRLIKKQLFKNPKIQLARTNVQHQTLFAKKKILELTGGFSTKYKIVSDYEWMLKTFLVNKCNYIYIDREISVMSTEGLSWKTDFEKERRKVMEEYFSPMEIFWFRVIPQIIKKGINTVVRRIFKM